MFGKMSVLCTFVANNVKTVIEKAKIGICAGNINVSDIAAGSVEHDDNEPPGDRFRLALPYAGHHIVWEILYNSCYPKYPPEIILGPDEEEFNPDIDTLQNYCSWDSSDEMSLLLTLRELMTEYRKYHLSLLSGSRLEFDYNSLHESCGCQPEDIEVYVTRKNGYSSGPVRFLIRLTVDFSEIPDYLLKKDSTEHMVLLLVTYQNLDGGTVTPQILPSPRIEQLFNIFGGVRILPFPHEGCLMDYVPAVQQHLSETIQTIVQRFEKRKEYIAAFVAHFGSQVVEFDSVGYNRVVSLFEWQNFRFIVAIELNLKFPQEQPTFTFQSVYHTKSDGFPFSRTYNRYPYSPRWESAEMAERARAFILATVPTFQKDSVQDF